MTQKSSVLLEALNLLYGTHRCNGNLFMICKLQKIKPFGLQNEILGNYSGSQLIQIWEVLSGQDVALPRADALASCRVL